MTMRQWIAFAFMTPLALIGLFAFAQLFRLAFKASGVFDRVVCASIILAVIGMFTLAL